MQYPDHIEPPPAFLSRAQVAAVLGVSPGRVDQLAAAGRLEWTETPVGRLYHREAVEHAREAREAAAWQATPGAASRPNSPEGPDDAA